MPDHIVRCLLDDGAARVVAAITTDLSREAARRHGSVAGTAVALSRSATSALLLATLTKGGERVMLQLNGRGPLGEVVAEADDAGSVRVYAKHATILVPAGSERRVLLGDAVGRNGVVSVIRDLGLKERYQGQSPVVTGEIDEDVENYLRQSEQIESALGCETTLTEAADVRAAGGVLVQCMPGGDSQVVREAQLRMRTAVLYDALAQGGAVIEDAVALAHAVLGAAGARLKVIDTRPLRFQCQCSRERVIGMLQLLAEDELASMIEEGKAEITCNFCNEPYALSKGELEKVRDERQVMGKS